MGNKIDIPGTLHSTATGNVVVETNEVFDTNKGKKQNQLNTEMQGSIDAEIERAAGAEAGLSNRLEAVEELAEISVEGGTLELATSSSDITSGSGKVPTANAVNEVLQGIGYFECSTAAAEAAKTIAATGYSLRAGGNIRIKMTNANTADAVTLNINNTGAKALFYNGAQASSTNSWEAGEVIEVYYDGTQFQSCKNISGAYIQHIELLETEGADSTIKRTYGDKYYSANESFILKISNFTGATTSMGTQTLVIRLLSKQGDYNTYVETLLEVTGRGTDSYYIQYTPSVGGYLYIFSRSVSEKTFYTNTEKIVDISKKVPELDIKVNRLETDVNNLKEKVISIGEVSNVVDSANLFSFNTKARSYINGSTGAYYTGTYGSTGVYYSLVSFIDVNEIKSIQYNLPFLNQPITDGIALIAAYDEEYNYIPSNSIVVYERSEPITKGVWEKGENTRYIRITAYYNNGTGDFYIADFYHVGNMIDNLYKSIESIEESLPVKTDINYLNEDRQTELDNLIYNDDALNLLHFSDLHYHPANMQRIMGWYNAHTDYIDEIINTGDTVHNNYGEPIGYGTTEGVEKVLNVIGNHDIYDGSGYSHSGIDGYNTYIKPYITTSKEVEGETVVVDNWNVTQPTDAEANGYCYYYKDYATQGIRVIVLDAIVAYTTDGAQRSWFLDILDDAKTQGLAVVVACHWIGLTKKAIKTHFATWNDGSNAGSVSSRLIAADIQDFIDGGGEFCCYLTGHVHRDIISTLEGYPNQICIAVGGANGLSSGNYKISHFDEVRVIGKRSQDSFNIVSISKTQHTISIVKIGIDSNIFGQMKTCVVLDYKTQSEIFSEYV